MPYNISIKFHPIPSTLNFSCFFCGFHGNGGHFENSVNLIEMLYGMCINGVEAWKFQNASLL
jgi:hypothetical protein